VLQQAELDRALVVRPDGAVIVPLVGAVPVSGLTIREAEELIRQRLRLFNREIGEVSLTVTQYNALKISVLGAVVHPGEFTFQTSPNLWDAVRAAGGAAPEANLASVRLVRTENGRARTEVHDLSALMSDAGSVAPVQLLAGDAVIVPTRDEAVVAPAGSGVQVLGSVARQGSLPLTEPARLVSVMLMAGGPLETSNLSSVWLVHPEGGSKFRALKIDVGEFLEQGSLSGNPLVYPGDTVRVPYRGTGFFRSVWPILLSAVTATSAIIIASNR